MDFYKASSFEKTDVGEHRLLHFKALLVTFSRSHHDPLSHVTLFWERLDGVLICKEAYTNFCFKFQSKHMYVVS